MWIGGRWFGNTLLSTICRPDTCTLFRYHFLANMYIESLSGSLRNDFRTVLLALVPSRAISRFICRTPIYFFLFLSPKFDGVYLRKKMRRLHISFNWSHAWSFIKRTNYVWVARKAAIFINVLSVNRLKFDIHPESNFPLFKFRKCRRENN